MTKIQFELPSDEDLIVVQGTIQGYPVRMAIDTAATHTVLDSNILFILGYNTTDLGETIQIESANGEITAYLFEAIDFSVLGIEFKKFPLMTYDYLSKGIISPHDGVIGLDLFKDSILTINFQSFEISLDF
jgi:hypothetical protein